MQHEIAERLRNERLSLGLSQAEMGRFGGVTARSQRSYEAGARSPDSGYLAAIGAHGVDLLYVFTGKRCEAQIVAREAVLYSVAERLGIDDSLVESVVADIDKAVVEFAFSGGKVAAGARAEYAGRAKASVDRLMEAASEHSHESLFRMNEAEQDFLSTVIHTVEAAIEGQGMKLNAIKKAQTIMTVYIGSRSTRIVSPDFVRSVLKLVA